FVDALEAAAEDDGAGSVGQRRDPNLGERNPARAHDKARARIAGGRGRVPGAGAHGGAHHPARAAAGGGGGGGAGRCGPPGGGVAAGCARMSTASSVHRPAVSALPARLKSSGPGNISGKMVRMVARHMMLDLTDS